MNNIEKHSKIVEYIKQYEGLWCGTNFRGYYLVISADDLWDHYFCKEEEATDKYLKDFEARGMYAIKYVIGSNKYAY